jgi:hypothetical protein
MISLLQVPAYYSTLALSLHISCIPMHIVGLRENLTAHSAHLQGDIVPIESKEQQGPNAVTYYLK